MDWRALLLAMAVLVLSAAAYFQKSGLSLPDLSFEIPSLVPGGGFNLSASGNGSLALNGRASRISLHLTRKASLGGMNASGNLTIYADARINGSSVSGKAIRIEGPVDASIDALLSFSLPERFEVSFMGDLDGEGDWKIDGISGERIEIKGFDGIIRRAGSFILAGTAKEARVWNKGKIIVVKEGG